MTNFDVAQDALQTSLDSEGSAVREHEKWMESLEAKLLQLKAAWQGLSQAFMGSDFLKNALDVIIKLVEGLTVMIDKVGTLPTLLAGFAAFKGFLGGGLFSFNADTKQFQILGKSIDSYKDKFKPLNSAMSAHRSEIARISTAQKLYGKNMSNTGLYAANLGSKLKSMGNVGKTAAKSLTSSFLKTNAAAIATNVGLGLLQGGLIALATVALSAVISKVTEYIVTAEELAEKPQYRVLHVAEAYKQCS